MWCLVRAFVPRFSFFFEHHIVQPSIANLRFRDFTEQHVCIGCLFYSFVSFGDFGTGFPRRYFHPLVSVLDFWVVVGYDQRYHWTRGFFIFIFVVMREARWGTLLVFVLFWNCWHLGRLWTIVCNHGVDGWVGGCGYYLVLGEWYTRGVASMAWGYACMVGLCCLFCVSGVTLDSWRSSSATYLFDFPVGCQDTKNSRLVTMIRRCSGHEADKTRDI